MPCKNKQLKKMLGIYWEVCHKRGSDGKLKQEMILVWYIVYYTASSNTADLH